MIVSLRMVRRLPGNGLRCRRAVVVDRARAAADLPLDRALGLCSGFSLGMVTALSKLCAQMAYAAAGVRFKGHRYWAPSPRAALRMVDVLPNALARFDKGSSTFLVASTLGLRQYRLAKALEGINVT